MNLTEHFTLDELTHTSHRQFDNTPNEVETANLQRLAELLEGVKEALGGKPESQPALVEPYLVLRETTRRH